MNEYSLSSPCGTAVVPPAECPCVEKLRCTVILHLLVTLDASHGTRRKILTLGKGFTTQVVTRPDSDPISYMVNGVSLFHLSTLQSSRQCGDALYHLPLRLRSLIKLTPSHFVSPPDPDP